MRRMILRMIATGSLSAFSASVLHNVGATPALRHRERAPDQVQISASPLAKKPLVASEQQSPAAPAGRIPPRGSLLDIRV